jgi:hypothetical protein
MEHTMYIARATPLSADLTAIAGCAALASLRRDGAGPLGVEKSGIARKEVVTIVSKCRAAAPMSERSHSAWRGGTIDEHGLPWRVVG